MNLIKKLLLIFLVTYNREWRLNFQKRVPINLEAMIEF